MTIVALVWALRLRARRRACCLLCLPLLGAARPARGQAPSGSEDAIRAAIVQHLTLFVEWPKWKMDASHAHFTVCLIGSDPIGPALGEAFHDKTVLQKMVEVVHLQGLEQVQNCHLLYVGGNARRMVERSLSALEGSAVLTVSERPGMASAGQIVGLPREDNRVRIEINLKAATESQLAISSRLLHLATVTDKP